MKNFFNGNKVVKSFVLAGALSFGVFAGSHITLAASPDQVKADHTVHVENVNTVTAGEQVKSAFPAVLTVDLQANSEAEVKVNNSHASVHASETANIHAAPNLDVLEKSRNAAAQEVKTEAASVQAHAKQAVDSETEVTVKQATGAVSKLQKIVKLTNDVAKKTEARTAVSIKAKEDKAGEATEKGIVDAEKVTHSFVNKVNSRVSELASKADKEHAAVNSALSAGEKTAVEAPKEKAEIPSEGTTKEAAEAKVNIGSEILTANAKAQAGLKAEENANNHAVKSSTALTGSGAVELKLANS